MMKISNIKKITEGLKLKDLDNLVSSTISIDEYEGKIDPDSIVVCFFVKEKDAANDLNRFIQKGINDILDTEASNFPDVDGNYSVFVEFDRNETVIDEIFMLLETISLLVDININEWEFITYNKTDTYKLTRNNVETNIRLKKKFKFKRSS